MNNDRELLELAAKAAGYDFYWMTGAYWLKTDDPLRDALWNPLTDDGDALRLAVKLHIGVAIESYAVRAYTRIRNTANVAEYTNADYSVAEATRHAIVRAAAEIGKEQK